jgi:PAS domain S-box-containing protein
MTEKDNGRSILDTLQVAYFEVDATGRLNALNTHMCSLLGHTCSKIRMTSFLELVEEQDHAFVVDSFSLISRGETPFQKCRIVLRSADGTPVHAEVSMVPIMFRDGSVSGVRGVVRDVTRQVLSEQKILKVSTEMEKTNMEIIEMYGELKAAQSKMLHSEKMASIGQLAAGVAHEINNPIGFISSNINSLNKYLGKLVEYIDLLEDQLGKSGYQDSNGGYGTAKEGLKIDYIRQDAADLISESLSGVDRVKKIVQNLKSFSRIDEAELQDADLNECMDTTLNIIWNELKYHANVVKDYGSIPKTMCFPQELNQVFMNLLMNAAQSIRDHGEIRIRTWHDGPMIMVEIADTGSGIPRELVDRIFEPFFTTKEVGKGTGLGLSISYDIVKKHKGDISVKSEPGKGTVFTVNIPVVKGE